MKIFALCSFVLLTTAANAQNLVPNPDFETVINPFCGIAGAGDFDNSFANWFSATNSTPDPFFTTIASSCYNFQPNSAYSGPIGIKGSQLPRSGNAMAGAIMFTIPTFEQRDYIQVELTTALTVGGTYAVEFYVSLADSTEYATSEIGAHLSTAAIFQSGDGVLPLVPQIQANSVISDDQNWTQIIDTITVSQAFTHLTIGNFNNDNSTTLVTNPTFTATPGNYGSYYYIDDIRVERIFLVGTEENQLDNLAVYPNPFNDYLIIDLPLFNQVYSIKITDGTGRVVIQTNNLTGKNSIPTESLEKGIYHVSVTTDYESFTQIFVK